MRVRDIIAEYDIHGGQAQDPAYWRKEIDRLDFAGAGAFRTEAADALDRLCGRWIGGGAYRQVWEHRDDPDLVVKIDGLGRISAVTKELHDGKAAHNYRERRNWLAAKGTELEQWFAPITWASPDCWVILQAKAEQLPTGEADPAAFPDRMPGLFAVAFDTQTIGNWGVIDGRPVIIDYSWVLPEDMLKYREPAPVRVAGSNLRFDTERRRRHEGA